MAQRTLRAEKFKGLTDLPLYNRDTSWLKQCQNFRVMPSGYLEARQGFQKIKPSGGTAADPISAGIFIGGHEHTMADGYIFTYEASTGAYTGNFAQRAYFEIFSSTDDEQHDAIYIGSTIGKFSRVVWYLGQGTMGASDPVLAYEYPQTAAWDTDGTAASTGDLTLTSTPNWEATGEQLMEWPIPSDWVKTVRNGIYGWWVRVRIATLNDGFTTAVRQGGTSNAVPSQRVYVDWPGAREIYVASANSAAATNNGTLKYYGQSDATTAAWQSVSTSLFSGNYPRARFASYRNILYMVNGKEQKRWDSNTLADIGFTTPDLTTTAATPVAGAGTGLGNGVWLYAMTYGYGPNGEWGESSYAAIGTAATTVSGANDGVRLEWAFNTTPGSDVDVIYLYRTQNLTSAQASGQAAFPYYRFKTMYRNSAGTLPSGTGASGPHTDETLALPFPPVDLDVALRTPPSRCRFIGVHKNRMFLASNNQYPGRVWWSQPFQSEAFNTDEDFADFTRSTGGQVTGIVEFADQMVVFTEDKMFGIANVDQDQPSIYEIAVVGCVAPDSIASSDGNLMWLGRNGVYRWTGEGLPQRVSNDTSVAFGKLSFETHGGSRAVIHNRMYETYLISNDATELATPRYRYDLVTDSWSLLSLGLTGRIAPLVVVTAPLGHADAGVRHPLYGQADKVGTNYAIYIGEYTESDDGSAFTCRADVHFGPPLYKRARPDSAFAVFNGGSSAGWNTPTISAVTGSYIDTAPDLQTAGPTDGATDYSLVEYVYTNPGEGSGDHVVSFQVTTVTTTGTITAGNEGKLLGVYLDADILDPADGI